MRGGSTVYIADADGTNPRELPIDPASGLEWSPDGKHLAFLSEGPDDIHRVNVADIDGDGVLTGLRQLALDRGTTSTHSTGQQVVPIDHA